MNRLTDSERTILQDQEADAREIGRLDDPPTEDELDEMCEGYDCLEDVWESVMDAAFPPDDTTPY